MNWLKRLSVLTAIAALVLSLAPDAEAKRKKKKKERPVAEGPMDDGRLVPSWFGENLAFVETDEVDYFWAKPGFSIDGQTFHFQEWPEVEFVGDDADDRDENDRRLARQMNSDMHQSFRDSLDAVLGGRADFSLDEGNVLVEGRIVDCSTGSTAAKVLVGFGAGSGNTTINLRFTDKASGELLAAVHHRVVSGTTWSTTDSKFFKWIKKFAEEIDDRGLEKMYEKGDSVDD